MEYKWNEQQLKEELKRNKSIGNEWNTSVYQEMIGVLHNEYSPNESDWFNGIDTYKTMRDRFFYRAELLSPDMINYLATIFTTVPTEEKVLSVFDYKKIDLTNDELVTIVYDILKTLDDKYVLKVYNEFIRDEHDYLNLQPHNKSFERPGTEITGLTYYDKCKHKSYISIQRQNTVEDIKALTHEVLHAVFNKRYRTSVNRASYFTELEGRFANQLAFRYLKENGMKDEGISLEAQEYILVMCLSYILYLNDVLFATTKNSKFRFKDATNRLQKTTRYKTSVIREKDLQFICSENLFYACNDILCYLLSLEVHHMYDDPVMEYHTIKQIKKHDNFKYINKQLHDEFDLEHIRNKTLKKEKRVFDRYYSENKNYTQV